MGEEQLSCGLGFFLGFKVLDNEDNACSLKKNQEKHILRWDASCHNILSHAIYRDNFGVIRFFLKSEKYDIPHGLLVDIVWKSFASDRADIFALLVENYSDLSVPGSSLMHIAVRWRHKTLVERIYQHHKDVDPRDAEGKTPLHYVVSENDLWFINFLCDRYADVHAEDHNEESPFRMAMQGHNAKVVLAMLGRHFPKERYRIRHQIYLGIEKGDTEGVFALIKAYPSCINGKDENGRTPLYCAIEWKRLDIIRMFIDRGSRLDVEDWNKDTPLDIAMKEGILPDLFQKYSAVADDIYSVLRADRYGIF